MPSGWVLERALASGGMAEIFLARRGDGARAVVKRLHPSLADDAEAIARLAHEARVGAMFEHPNLVRVLDAGIADGRPFLAMEHVAGPDLRAIIGAIGARGLAAITLAQAIAIAIGVAGGLDHAHALGIVHGDVSPANVLVGADGVPRLVDFGVATSPWRAGPGPGRVEGKPGYASPEQARGAPLDGRSDVFALGTILFELTTARRLFRGDTDLETLKLVETRDAPRPSDVSPGYPPALEPIVLRALARAREARPTAAALARDLTAFARAATLDVSPAPLAALVAAVQ